MKNLFLVFKRALAPKSREFWSHAEKSAFREAFRNERSRKVVYVPWS